jgi:hypothetical protein
MSSSARATVLLRVSVDELISKADLIFTGSVSDVKVIEKEEDGQVSISTEVVFNVDKWLRGDLSGKTFSLTLLGGKGKKFIMPIPGMPQFEKGEEVLLFLEKTPKHYIPMGLIQGKFRIEKNPATNKKTASRLVSGATVGSFDEKGIFRMSSPDNNSESFNLNDLIKKIRTFNNNLKK